MARVPNEDADKAREFFRDRIAAEAPSSFEPGLYVFTLDSFK